jgi:hypothetical protein
VSPSATWAPRAYSPLLHLLHPPQLMLSRRSIIFSLYLSSLPWQSGGEYLAFYRVVCRLVEAWRAVGLEPTFVFDGESGVSVLKHELHCIAVAAVAVAAR